MQKKCVFLRTPDQKCDLALELFVLHTVCSLRWAPKKCACAKMFCLHSLSLFHIILLSLLSLSSNVTLLSALPRFQLHDFGTSTNDGPHVRSASRKAERGRWVCLQDRPHHPLEPVERPVRFAKACQAASPGHLELRQSIPRREPWWVCASAPALVAICSVVRCCKLSSEMTSSTSTIHS